MHSARAFGVGWVAGTTASGTGANSDEAFLFRDSRMNRARLIGFLLFCWAEILVGTAGSAVFLVIVAWLLHGSLFVPNFGDSNIAAVFAMILALFLWPCVFILIAGIGVLRRKPWARTMNLVMYPILGVLSYWATGFLMRGPGIGLVIFIVYAALTLVSVWVLARRSVLQRSGESVG